MTKIFTEINDALKENFERNRAKYNRYYTSANEGARSNPPRLKKYRVFEPLGNGARFPAYTFKLTSLYGKRGRGFHRGEDLRTVNVFYPGHELPMQAVEDGVVLERKYSRLWGEHVIIKHPNGLETLYAHNSRVFVEKGAKVEKGRVISLSGETGRVTGPHMHFAVRARVSGSHYWFPPSRVDWRIPIRIGIVNARGGLSLREGAGRTAKRLELIPNGAAMQILKTGPRETIGGRRAAWVRVQYGYVVGWVFSAYLETTLFKSPSSTRSKRSAKTRRTAADPLSRLRKLKKEELLRLAMDMGISLPTRTRKARVLELLLKHAREALKSAESPKAPGLTTPRALPGITSGLNRELQRAGIKTVAHLAGFKAVRTAQILAALGRVRS